MKIHTGVFRQDIQVIPPGKHGNYAMFFDPVSESYYRVSTITALIASKMVRDYELDQFIEVLAKNGVKLSSQDLMQILLTLRNSNLLVPDTGAYEARQEQMRKAKKSTVFMRIASVYSYFKLPPLYPGNFLLHFSPAVKKAGRFFSIWMLLIPALLGYILMLRDFSTVRALLINSFSWAGLVKYFFTIVLLKVVHECAHSLVATYFGCRVRAVGVNFIFFYPRIFTDTTDSWRLSRSQRLWIDSAGMLSELIIGGFAALLWVYLPPGGLKSTMFYIFAVGSLSTIFVNGNPLIRFDGYYILCDLLNIENLMSRSTECVKSVWRKVVFQVGRWPDSEHIWALSIFGISAFIYRFLLYTSIILVIYVRFVKTVAVVLLLLEVYTFLIFPIWREYREMKLLLRSHRPYIAFGLTAIILCLFGYFLFVPLSWNEILPGEVRAENRSLVTVMEGGFLQTDLPEIPPSVKKGSELFRVHSTLFDLSVERLKAMMDADEVLWNLQQADRASFGDSILTWKKMESNQVALQELTRREALHRTTADSEGIFVPKVRKLSRGIFLPSGVVLGELVSRKKVVYAYADEHQIRLLKSGSPVTLRVPDRLTTYSGSVQSVHPVPFYLRESPVLQSAGGPIPITMDEKRAGDFHSAEPLYLVVIDVAEDFPLQNGRSVRAYVVSREVLASRIQTLLISFFRREF